MFEFAFLGFFLRTAYVAPHFTSFMPEHVLLSHPDDQFLVVRPPVHDHRSPPGCPIVTGSESASPSPPISEDDDVVVILLASLKFFYPLAFFFTSWTFVDLAPPLQGNFFKDNSVFGQVFLNVAFCPQPSSVAPLQASRSFAIVHSWKIHFSCPISRPNETGPRIDGSVFRPSISPGEFFFYLFSWSLLFYATRQSQPTAPAFQSLDKGAERDN